MDKNRKLQLAGVLTVVLSRVFNAPEVFSDEDVFRNVRNERLIVRKSMYDWLKRSKRIEGHPEGYRILDRPGIAAAISALRASPIPTVNGFLNFRPGEVEEEEGSPEDDGKPEAENVEDEMDGVDGVDSAVETVQEPVVSLLEDENYPEEEADIDVPPVKDTIRELESMIVGAGTKNRARYVLSIHALTVMLGYAPDGTFSTRKDMFTIRKSIHHERCVANEVFAKSWQKVFLDRTEEIGLTEKTLTGRESAYRIADGRANEVIKMVSDAVHLDGLSLRKILWPGQYADDNVEQEPEESEEAQGPRQDGAVEVLTELVGQLTSVAESMSHVNDSMQAVLAGLSELGEQGRERERRAQESLENVLTSLSSIVSKLDREERDAIVSMKDRLIEIQSRRKSLSNQLESEVVREERLIQEIGSVLGKRKS